MAWSNYFVSGFSLEETDAVTALLQILVDEYGFMVEIPMPAGSPLSDAMGYQIHRIDSLMKKSSRYGSRHGTRVNPACICRR